MAGWIEPFAPGGCSGAGGGGGGGRFPRTANSQRTVRASAICHTQTDREATEQAFLLPRRRSWGTPCGECGRGRERCSQRHLGLGQLSPGPHERVSESKEPGFLCSEDQRAADTHLVAVGRSHTSVWQRGPSMLKLYQTVKRSFILIQG